MSVDAFLGLKSTGDFVTDEMPENWREGVARFYPNGDAPLTALTSMMKSSSVDSPELNWWDKMLPAQSAALLSSGLYDDAALGTAYTSAADARGTMVYANLTEANSQQFRAGHQVRLIDASDYRATTVGKIIQVHKNGNSSYLAVRLLEAANYSADPAYGLAGADTVSICGNINPEGGPTPAAITYKPTKYENKTQIFRSPLDLTRTAMKTHVRTGDVYKEAKLDALELNSIEIEKALFWSVMSETIGDNGKPERTMAGLVPLILQYAPNNVKDFQLDTDFSGDSWVQSGEDFLDKMLELIYRYGKDEKLCLLGSGAMLGITKLAKTYGNINLTPRSVAFGLNVVEWIPPGGGVLYLKRHPLFSYETVNRHSMVIIEPARLEYRYIDDTFFKKDETMREGGQIGIDGILEEFVTEFCLEYHFIPSFGYLNGIGLDNNL